MTRPRVSVVLTVRDGERYIAEAVDSILRQTVRPDEIVVVDDGSTDGTPLILDAYGDALRIICVAPAGQFAAMNRGVQEGTGDVLSFLDADDIWTPRSVETRLTRMAAGDRPDAVFGKVEQFLSPELGAEERIRFRFDVGPMRARLFQAMLVRRSAYERVGPLDTSMLTSANIDWISRAEQQGLRAAEVEDVVCRRRIHGANRGIIRRDDRKRNDLHEVVRADRNRRRGGNRSG